MAHGIQKAPPENFGATIRPGGLEAEFHAAGAASLIVGTRTQSEAGPHAGGAWWHGELDSAGSFEERRLAGADCKNFQWRASGHFPRRRTGDALRNEIEV